MEKEFTEIQKYLKNAHNILLVSHRKPDPDTIGAAVAIKFWLEKEGKPSTLACVDKPSKSFSFFSYFDHFVQYFDLKNFDLIFILDSGASYMTNFHLKYADFFTCGIPIINIDHHASNDNFGTVNIVDPSASSTTVLIYRLFHFLNIDITADMATALLAGVCSDTGGFMHSNTNDETFQISADLMNKGARLIEINKALFRNSSIPKLRLWGKVLEKAYINDENVVVSVLKDSDFDTLGATPDNLSGVIDFLSMVPDTKYAILLNEDRNGNVKGSFRTRNDNIDLSRIAQIFGGGGHPKASGFSIPGKIVEESRYKIITDDLSKKSIKF